MCGWFEKVDDKIVYSKLTNCLREAFTGPSVLAIVQQYNMACNIFTCDKTVETDVIEPAKIVG